MVAGNPGRVVPDKKLAKTARHRARTVFGREGSRTRALMLFKGADGAPYEVRGEAGFVFNILSSPRLSINSLFDAVPPQFPTLAVGDTVLGDLGIALCGADGGAAVRLHLDVATGNLTLAHEAGSSAEDALAAASEVGAVVRLERFLCDLKQMNCSWVDVAFTLDTTPGGGSSGGGSGGGGGGVEPGAALRWTEGSRVELPLMDSGHSRLSMRSRQLEPGVHDELKISIARNALVAPDTDVDCEDFTAWEVAHAACLHLIGGTAPPERREEWALLLTMPYLEPHMRFHLAQLDVPAVEPTSWRGSEAGWRAEQARIQRQVHGILGQRSQVPPTPEQVRERNRNLARGMARDMVVPFFGDEHAEGHTAAEAAAAAEVQRHAEATESAEKVVRWSGNGAAAGSLGRKARLAAEKFGLQGEGALEGGYRHYKMGAQHQHDFRFSRFNCSDEPFEFAPSSRRAPASAPPVETQSIGVVQLVKLHKTVQT